MLGCSALLLEVISVLGHQDVFLSPALPSTSLAWHDPNASILSHSTPSLFQDHKQHLSLLILQAALTGAGSAPPSTALSPSFASPWEQFHTIPQQNPQRFVEKISLQNFSQDEGHNLSPPSHSLAARCEILYSI